MVPVEKIKLDIDAEFQQSIMDMGGDWPIILPAFWAVVECMKVYDALERRSRYENKAVDRKQDSTRAI